MSSKHKSEDKGLGFGLVLNGIYTVIEFGFGIFTGSLALIADATHNLTDTFTLTISYLASRVARKNADKNRTFGYGRATILAALLNSSVMIAVALFIGIEAIKRLQNPVEINGGVVALVALVGIGVNGSIAYILSKNKNDLNMRSAYIDMTFDAISSLGAVVAGLVMMFTGINYIDAFVGLFIAALLLYNTLNILKEAVHILLEGTPKDVDILATYQAIADIPKVLHVDDMHVWAIRSGYNSLSCHIAIDKEELRNSRIIVEQVKSVLKKDHKIHHATIEVELEHCATHTDHEQH